MPHAHENQPATPGLTRRDFLRTGSLGAGAVGLTLAGASPAAAGKDGAEDVTRTSRMHTERST